MKYNKVFNIDAGDRLFFMSDLHIGHQKILEFSRSQFDNIGRHDSWIQNSLINYTKPGDWIIDLGDMFWKKTDTEISEFLEKLPGRHLIKVIGNHDSPDVYTKSPKVNKFFPDGIFDILDIQVKYGGSKYLLSLSHYPEISWNHKAWGSLHLFGHCHGNIDSFVDSRKDLMVDVGVDGELAKKLGTFIIPFEDIYKHFWKKTHGIDFREWTRANCKEL